MAIRIGEHPQLRLPVIVSYDGFFTSHQKRRVSILDDESVQRFVGKVQAPYTALDPEHPVTIGPYMNDPDLINNKYQMKLAFDAAHKILTISTFVNFHFLILSEVIPYLRAVDFNCSNVFLLSVALVKPFFPDFFAGAIFENNLF